MELDESSFVVAMSGISGLWKLEIGLDSVYTPAEFTVDILVVSFVMNLNMV